jgi:integrase
MASVTPRKNKDGKIISFKIRVSRGKKLKPYEMTWPPKGTKIPDDWSETKIDKEVHRIADQFENECKNGHVSLEKKSFFEYANYVIDLKQRTYIKKSTAERYRTLLERINDIDCDGFGYVKIDEVRVLHLNRFYKRLSSVGMNKKTGGKLSNKTILEYHELIRGILAQAYKEGFVTENVADRATPPKKENHEATFFEPDEVIAILKALVNESPKWQALTYLMIDTGARRGEILGIKWDSVNFETNTIHICNNVLYTKTDGVYEDTTKNYKNRVVAVSPTVMRVLAAWQEEQRYEREMMGNLWIDTGFVFTQKTGKVMHPDSVTDWFGKFSKRNNLPSINPHKFRHTQASLLIHEGVDIVSVSKRLGHSKVSTTTDFYSHILADADRTACDALDKVIFIPSSEESEQKKMASMS